MKNLIVDLPIEVDQKQAAELKMAVAIALYNKGMIAAQRAADFAGMSKFEFFASLGNKKLSINHRKIESSENTEL